MGNEKSIPCGYRVEGCAFDWGKYTDTLERFDQKIIELEKRVNRSIDALRSRTDKLEEIEAENRLKTLESAILQFIPEQNALLKQLQEGQGAIHEVLGEVKTIIGENSRRITDLEDFATKDVADTMKAKNEIWVERFKLMFGALLLTAWVSEGIFVHYAVPAETIAETPTWISWIIGSVVAFVFGESAVKRTFNAFKGGDK